MNGGNERIKRRADKCQRSRKLARAAGISVGWRRTPWPAAIERNDTHPCGSLEMGHTSGHEDANTKEEVKTQTHTHRHIHTHTHGAAQHGEKRVCARRRAETYPAEVEVDEGGVPADAELLRDAVVLGAVDLGDVDLPLQLRRQLLPHGGERLAVAAPRGVELDQPRARRGARGDLRVFGGAGVDGGRVCSVCQ